MKLLSKKKKNKVLKSVIEIIDKRRKEIISANKIDLELYDPSDRAMYDRLVLNDKKVDGMIEALLQVKKQKDPVGRKISEVELANGLKVVNQSAPFGTIMIIYESRPDVTVEAAVIAFKAGNQILLKGGKEAINTNKILVDCWHQALESREVSKDYVKLLEINREETQSFLINPPQKLDLIVPRGGEKLINFVKENANCAVLVSGRGNNFIYVHEDANWEMTLSVILNAKTQKISACNALDKILINTKLPNFKEKIQDLRQILADHKVEVLIDQSLAGAVPGGNHFADESEWSTEYLAMKIMIGSVDRYNDAVEIINKHSGGHSSAIMTSDDNVAANFMQEVDCAAVYHNASTRFTDGGQMGAGAELAISTDKLHHRGPLGLDQLVTNKYYIYGNGQVRK